MIKLVNHPLRSIWLKMYWMSIGPHVPFIVRSMLMIKKVISVHMSRILQKVENDEW